MNASGGNVCPQVGEDARRVHQELVRGLVGDEALLAIGAFVQDRLHQLRTLEALRMDPFRHLHKDPEGRLQVGHRSISTG